MRLDKFKELSGAGDRSLVLILDVRTRWNSTYAMIKRAIQLRNAYVSICNVDDDLAEYSLQESDWQYLQKLASLLELFNTLTNNVSASLSYPTVPLTIAVYNKLLDNIEDFITVNKESQPEICRGAAAAKLKLQKYYATSDNSPTSAHSTT